MRNENLTFRDPHPNVACRGLDREPHRKLSWERNFVVATRGHSVFQARSKLIRQQCKDMRDMVDTEMWRTRRRLTNLHFDDDGNNWQPVKSQIQWDFPLLLANSLVQVSYSFSNAPSVDESFCFLIDGRRRPMQRVALDAVAVTATCLHKLHSCDILRSQWPESITFPPSRWKG